MKAFTIWGPPGTGKTTEMIRRVSSMIDDGVPENDVYFMSFTKAAAQEALGRVGAHRAENFSTIHSLCYRLTGVFHGAVVDWRKLAEFSKLTGVRITSRAHDEDDLGEGDQYLQIIGKAENLIVPYDEVYESSSRPGSFDEFMMFSEAYNEWKKSNGYVDFNDMLRRTLGKGVVFGGSHLVVDEAQDLSPLQWKVINRLIELADPKEVHISGDDDQCLYSWCGANPHGMADFGEQNSASPTVLSQSWRVPRKAHKVAQGIITQIERRVEKKYLPRPDDGHLEYAFDFRLTEIDKTSDTMILGRTHSVLKEVEDILRDECIPYRKNGGVSLFNNKWAQSIRAITKITEGQSISDKEFTSLRSALFDPVLCDAVAAGDYSVVRGKNWREVLAIPGRLMSYYDIVDVNEEPTVTLSTIHGAKGKEADRVVLLTQLTGRVVESMNSCEGIDDERRVFYVGATRAKNRLDVIQDFDGFQI